MLKSTIRRIRGALGQLIRHDQVVLFILALVLGVLAAGAAIAFREALDLVQRTFYGYDSTQISEMFTRVSWWHILLGTTGGGLLVGLLTRFVMPDRRLEGVADVIEASALHGAKLSLRGGLGAAAVNALSLGVGASAGREGPVVHLGAALSTAVARALNLGATLSQTLLGCGVAAAIAASFNAPIAGVFFALEVVIGHYAISTFAPIVIASVVGTIVSRIYFGDFPAFVVLDHTIASFWEFPAFALLGVACAALAILFIRSIGLVEKVVERASIPSLLRPAIGGLIVGMIILAFPQVFGTGYDATNAALHGTLALTLLLALVAAKFIASAVSIGCGFGSGVFSPSLFLGAMLGGACGIIVTIPFPELSSGREAYAIVGMGAVAGAVLGAPMSTIMVIFELTGDYALTIAVMIATVIASLIVHHGFGFSFFSWQLDQRGLDVRGGREQHALRSISIQDVMRKDYVAAERTEKLASLRERLKTAPLGQLCVVDGAGVLHGTIELQDLGDIAFDTSRDEELTARDIASRLPPVLEITDTLDTALRLMESEREETIVVVDDLASMTLMGYARHLDVMTAYNDALTELYRTGVASTKAPTR